MHEEIVAYHEAGHLAQALLSKRMFTEKVSIIPKDNFSGYLLLKEGLNTTEVLVKCTIAGLAAERLYCYMCYGHPIDYHPGIEHDLRTIELYLDNALRTYYGWCYGLIIERLIDRKKDKISYYLSMSEASLYNNWKLVTLFAEKLMRDKELNGNEAFKLYLRYRIPPLFYILFYPLIIQGEEIFYKYWDIYLLVILIVYTGLLLISSPG